MKWYIWLAIAIALVLIIWAVTKKKNTPIGSGSAPVVSTGSGFIASGFNPYQLTNIA
jgi:hypothetical protein